MVLCRLASPWWYAVSADTKPDSCATCCTTGQHASVACNFSFSSLAKHVTGTVEITLHCQLVHGIQRELHGRNAAHLDILLDVALEAAEQDLALARLEAVHHVWDGALQVSAGEQDQLLWHKAAGNH